MKLHRKIEHNEKVCPAQELGPMPKVKVTIRSKVKLCLKLYCSWTTEANLMKLHRKMKHNEKVYRAHDVGSYAQGQGRDQVKGQKLVSAITQKLLKQI